ncbi:MAG: AsmA family protein [Chitinispirillaceae bacterium]|nr:AsmA family protein [Chitinispirillaceae bacterium]
MKKHTVRNVFIGLVVAFFIICIAGFVALRLLLPPEKIMSIASGKVAEVLERKVTIGKAGISVFPILGVSLSDVEIGNTERPGFDQSAFVKLERLSISISAISLLKRQPEIKKILIRKPFILLEKDANGSFNYEDLAVIKKDSAAKKEEKKGGLPMLPVPVSLRLFQIEDGTFIYRDAKSGQDISIGDLDDRIVFSIDRELKDISTDGDLSLTDVSVITKEIKKPLSNLSITLHHDIGADLVSGTAAIRTVRLSFQKVFLNLTGTLSDLNTVPKLDLTLTSDTIGLADLLAEIPVELVPVLGNLTASGKLALGLELKGALEKETPLPVKGNLSINEGLVQYKGLPRSINSIKAECSFTENSLDLSTLQMKFGENPAALRAKVNNFKKPVIDVKARTRLNLADSKDMIKLPPGSSLSGTVDLDILAKGEVDPSDPTKCNVEGKLGLHEVAVLWPPLVKPAVINGNFTLSSLAIGEQLSVVIGRSSMKMNATVKNYLTLVTPDSTKKQPRPSVNFTIASPVLDIDEFMPPEEKKVKKEKVTEKSGGPLIAPLPGVDTRGKITAKKVVYKKIPMDNVTILIDVVNDIAKVDIKSGFAGGTIAENIRADLRNTSDVSFNNKLTITRVEIGTILGSFGGFLKPTTAINREINNLQSSLFGKLTLTSDFSGRGGTSDAIMQTLTGDVALKMADGRIANSLIVNRLSGAVEKFIKIDDITFRELATSLRIENAAVLIRNLALQSSAGDWKATGKVGFDAALGVDLSNRLTKPMSNQVLKVQSGGKSVLKGLLKNTQFAQAAGSLIDNVGIPTDRDGRVTLFFALKGTASDPKASFTGFGEGTVKSQATPQKSVKEQAAKKIQETVNRKKAEAQQRLNEEKKKVEAKVEKRVEEKKQVIEQQKTTIEKNLKKDVGKKLKKLF